MVGLGSQCLEGSPGMCVYYTTVYVWITKEYRDREKKNGKEMEVTRKSGRRQEPPRGWEGLGEAGRG